MFRPFLIASAILVVGTTVGGGLSFAATTGHATSRSPVVGSSRELDPSECALSQPAIGRPSVLAVRIVRIDTGDVVLVNACIDGAGPFPFVIDSGSSFSVIDKQLARRFHLHQVGVPQQAAGIACSATVVPEQLSSWSVDGLALRPQVVFSASLPNLEPNQPLAGVIGSDVLSRFGSVRIDYHNRTVSLGAAESESPTADGVVRGPTSTPTPAQFMKDTRAEAELTIVTRQGGVVAYVPIEFNGSTTQPFVVDTGAAVSNISSPLAHSLHLANAHRSVEFSASFGCPVDLTEVKSGRWTVGSTPLPPQLVATLPAPGLQIAGLLGSDVLSHFGAVVIDYRAARILFES
ncbi:MAG: pepsin/retropepsin-like aspartic protease family protein [Acidimicrobiales bacterium]